MKQALLWTLVALFALRLGISTARAVPRPAHGFVSHYTAGRLLLEGENVARFYDDDWFAAQVRRFEPTVIDLYGANLPTMALFMTPIAALEYRPARAVWAGVSYLGLLFLLVFLARLCRLGPIWTPIYIGLGLAFQPVHENLVHAQMYVAVLALAGVAWSGFRRASAPRLGMPLGTLFCWKTAGLMYWPMLIAARRLRAFVWATLTVILISVASLALMGFDAWVAYFSAARELSGDASLSVTAYQTQLSLVRHLFVYDTRWNPAPLVNLPAVASVLSVTLVCALLGSTAFVAWKRRSDDLIFAAFSALTLILSPVSLDYHYTLALLPLAILLTDVRAHPISALVVMIGALLIAADLPFRSPQLAPGALSLFAYPKLYGAYLLWGVALWRAHRLPQEHS